jgi:hypothetical protein
MANMIVNLPMTAGEDLRNSLGLLVRVDNTGRVVRTTATTDTVAGVVSVQPYDSENALGTAVTIAQLQGTFTVVADAAITAGSLVHPTTTAGRVVGVANAAALPANVSAIGVALSAATAAGQSVRVLLTRISK